MVDQVVRLISLIGALAISYALRLVTINRD